MSTSLTVSDFKSDYLCNICGGILYCDSEDASCQFCINPACQQCNRAFSVVDPSAKASPQLHGELKEEEAKLIALIESCDHEALAMYVYIIRLALIDNAIARRVMPSIPLWHAIGDLLILMNAHSPKGSDRAEKTFESIVKMSYKRTEHLNFIENIENGRYKIVQSANGQMRVVQMKYLTPIHAALKAYGLASSGDLDSPDIFEFQDIEELVFSDVELKPSVDMADFFNTLLPYAITLRYGFGLHHRTSIQYRYTPERVDLPFLFGVFRNIKTKEPVFVPKEKLSLYFSKYEKYTEGRTFETLLNEYAQSSEKVPIMVPVGNRVIVDPLTLLYFIIHLHGQASVTHRLDNGKNISVMKKKAADIFEAKVRNELHKYGFAGPNSAVKVKYEYDIIGISEAKKRILVIDAKFRDISPSSISAQKLVEQCLMEPEEGLCDEVEAHKTRVEYLIQNLGMFKQHLKPSNDLRGYQIRPYIITKHTPLISQYKGIDVLSLTDLINKELKA